MKKTKLLSTTTVLVVVAMGLALLTPLAITVTASASASIKEYSVPTTTSIPQGITAGPDGNIWFAETKGDKIGKVTTSGKFTEYSLSTGSSPYGITPGPDGNLWFTEQIGNKIGRITPSGTITEYTIPTAGSQPWNITAGPDGNLWFTETNGNNIAKITTSGSFTEYPLPAWGGVMGITSGPDGNIWFTEPQGHKIGKITPSGIVTEYAIPTPATSLSHAWGITTGPDGNLWYTDIAGDKISKVTPSGSFTEYPLPAGMGGDPKGITTGPDGNLWYADYSGSIGMVTPSGVFTAYAVPTSDSGPEGITTGPDGNLWFTERNGNKIGSVLINPSVPPSAQWKSTFYFAEGYTGANFQEYACLENPNSKAADSWITCMFTDGTSKSQYYSLAPASRLTVDVNQLAGASRELSMRVVSTSQGIVAERPMYFNYQGAWSGGSDAMGATSPSKKWYFAEGNTLTGFDEYVTVQNPGGKTANLTFQYMVEGSGQKDVTAQVSPGSRATFKTVNQIGSGANASLFLSSDQDIVAERPMYFNYQGLAFNNWTGGHDVLGANSPAKKWYFAEGTTRAGFEEWLCLQNPTGSAIKIDAVYQLGAGQGSPIHKSYSVPAQQRLTVSVNMEIGADKDTSVYLSSTSAFVAERPVYFLYHNAWDGGHDVIGAKAPATTWLFAEGYTGANFEEWLCLQNQGAQLAHVTITYYPESGSPIKRSLTVAPNSRQTVDVNNNAGANLGISSKVTSDKPIIVERPMYFNYNGWTGGHDVVGLTP
jgi:streptogramin lyase